ncbi:MAG TPA: TIR domain-containing protein [Bryobacteraceae bacterium]|nr:TIR domain-containing protein [Bryobacteraceae bacterium]
MPGVFISYRHDDCPGDVARIYKALRDCFANQYIFLDVAAIKPGSRFDDAIVRRLECSDALIIAIGPRWLAVTQEGKRRLDEPDDFVRLEISIALASGLTIIPLLFRGATIPKQQQLPTEIGQLARIQAVRIDDAHFDADVRGVIRQIRSRFRIPKSKIRQALLLYAPGAAVGWALRAAMYVALVFALGWVPGLLAASPEARILDFSFVVCAFATALALRTWAHHLDVRCPVSRVAEPSEDVH